MTSKESFVPVKAGCSENEVPPTGSGDGLLQVFYTQQRLAKLTTCVVREKELCSLEECHVKDRGTPFFLFLKSPFNFQN